MTRPDAPLIEATVELLDGWCGWAWFEGQNCLFAHEADPRNPDGDYTVLHDDRICDVGPERLHLDLRRPEVRWRWSRVRLGASGVFLLGDRGPGGPRSVRMVLRGRRVAVMEAGLAPDAYHVPALATLPDTDTLAWACFFVEQAIRAGEGRDAG